MQDILGNNRSCEHVCRWLGAPCGHKCYARCGWYVGFSRATSTGIPSVLTRWLPRRRRDQCLPRAAITGSTGGVTRGGGKVVLACPLEVSPRFVISVKVCSVLLDAGVYSQHGSTL